MAMRQAMSPFQSALRPGTLARHPVVHPSRVDRFMARALSLEVMLGALLGLYVLVGRWSPFRLVGDHDQVTQVRFWILVALLGLLPVTVFRLPRLDRRFARQASVPAALFLAYMILTIAWTPFWEAAVPKALDLALILLVGLVTVPLLRRSDPRRLAYAFWWTVVVLAGLNAVLVTASGVWTLASGDRVTPLGGGPNVFARMMGLLCIAGAYFYTRNRIAVWWLALAAFAVVLVLASGSRGGLLALPLALLALWAKSTSGRLRALTAGVLLAGAVSFLAAYTDTGANALETFDRRIRQLTFEQRYDSGRTAIYERAFQMGMESPLTGSGLDAFQLTDYHGLYQHNLLLEAFSEGGLMALVLLMWLIGVALRHLMAVDTVEGISYGAAFVMIAAGSQVSGDLFDSRALFLLPLLLASTVADRHSREARWA